eukprot:7621-Heterococcus_DN1.PRE.3
MAATNAAGALRPGAVGRTLLLLLLLLTLAVLAMWIEVQLLQSEAVAVTLLQLLATLSQTLLSQQQQWASNRQHNFERGNRSRGAGATVSKLLANVKVSDCYCYCCMRCHIYVRFAAIAAAAAAATAAAI